MPSVLLIEPDDARREAWRSALAEAGFAVHAHAAVPDPLPDELEGADCVLVPHDADTLSFLAAVRRRDPLLPVVACAPRRPDPEQAVALGRARIHDVVVARGPGDAEVLVARVRQAADKVASRRRVPRVAEEILGTSDKMAQVRRYIERAASSDANVLITGESGTGKELVASAIHRHSDRGSGPFVAINCSAIPENLLESELFGHERGSFTGAVGRTRGYFEQADGGTLFFDEIGEMPLALQAKLLRALQPPPGCDETVREFTRVGGDGVTRTDVRVLFATHRDVTQLVASGKFREDLFQRLAVLQIRLPPLRERREDVRLLADIFLLRYGATEGRPNLEFDPLVMDVLVSHAWPLNVRELESVIRSLVIVKDSGGTVVLGDLPPSLFGGEDLPSSEPPVPARLPTLEEVELEHVRRVLAHVGGNKSRAARVLAISRPALDRKLERCARLDGVATD